MPDNESKSLDLLGVKPVGEAVKIATEETFRGAEAFFGRICLPAAEEFGLLLRDRITHWRANQAAKIAERAEAKILKAGRGNVRALPRVVFEVIDKGSWTDDDIIQDAWAGILASACTEDGGDDSNIVFTSLLAQLTGVQLRILNYCVEACPKFKLPKELPFAKRIQFPFDKLVEVSGCEDAHRLDRELDHLRALELIGPGGFFGGGGGFDTSDSLDADIRVTPLAIYLYVRGQGFVGTPGDFFGLELEPEKDPNEGSKSSEEGDS